MIKKLLRPCALLLFQIACGQTDEFRQNDNQSKQHLVHVAPIVAAVLGDYGAASPAERQVAQLIAGWKPALIVTTGDNNYPDGAEATLDDNIGQFYHPYIRFGPQYRGLYRHAGASAQAFFPTLGNHDWRAAHAAPYLRYFDLPGNKRYYSVERGPLAFFMLDSDPHEPDGIGAISKQGRWLEAALKASTARWKIVVFHHPPYSTGAHGDTPYMRWPFSAWGATAVLCGHDHHYERIIKDGMHYIVVGTGGAPLRHAHGKHAGVQFDFVYTKMHGALKVTADADALTMSFYNTNGACIDGWTVSE